MNVETKVPIQRQNNLVVNTFKKLIKTQAGKAIAFHAGLKGFDRVGMRTIKFKRMYQGEKLRSDEQLIDDKVYAMPGKFMFSFVESFNSRVNKGAALQASLMAGSALGSCSSPLPPLYIALSTASLTPAYGDTTLASETAKTGVARALGAAQNYVSPGTTIDGAASYDVYKQFTLTDTATTLVSMGLFDAASTGNMFMEANFGSSAVMATSDIIQVTVTINL